MIKDKLGTSICTDLIWLCALYYTFNKIEKAGNFSDDYKYKSFEMVDGVWHVEHIYGDKIEYFFIE